MKSTLLDDFYKTDAKFEPHPNMGTETLDDYYCGKSIDKISKKPDPVKLKTKTQNNPGSLGKKTK
jgi:hypothetical protein